MAHVQVPTLSIGNISAPARPSDPPNVQDVMDAMRLAARVHESYQHTPTASRSSQPKAIEDDVVKTKIYEHQVVHAAAFTPYHDDICAIVTWAVTDAISPVNARLEAMEHHLDAMEHRLTARLDELEHHFTAHLDELVEVSYQSYNLSCGTGNEHTFKIIPFRAPNGQLQAPGQRGLQLLHNHQSIVNLSDQDLDAYFMGYRLKRTGNPNHRTKIDRLMSHVGCGMP